MYRFSRRYKKREKNLKRIFLKVMYIYLYVQCTIEHILVHCAYYTFIRIKYIRTLYTIFFVYRYRQY